MLPRKHENTYTNGVSAKKRADRFLSVERGLGGSNTVKEALIDNDLFDHSCRYAKPVLLQQVAEVVTVDQVDGWRSVSTRFSFGAQRERAGGDHQTLVSATSHGTPEVPDRAGRNTPGVALALEIARKAEERGDFVYAHPVDSAVARLAKHLYVAESSLSQQAHRKPLKGRRVDCLDFAEQLILPVEVLPGRCGLVVGLFTIA